MYNVNTDLYAFGTDLWRQDSELTFEAVCTLWCPFDEPVRRYVYNIWCGFVVYKTELIWTGTKHNLSKIPGFGCAFTLGGAHAHVAQSDDVRVLGVQLSSDLSLDKHVNVVSAKCCFQLRQLRSIRHSLGDDPVAALVHAFVASRVDYCGSLLIGAPRKTTDKLQRVLNSAARIVSNTRKFDRDSLISGEVSYNGWTLSTEFGSEFASRCSDVCTRWLLNTCLPTAKPVSGISGRRHLRSAERVVISTSHV